MDDRIVIDQEKYILENIRAVDLPKGRKGDKDVEATPGERQAFTTLVYQLSWVGKESRPEVSGVASLLSSYVHHPTIAHIMEANRAAQLLRTSAGQQLTIWSLDPFYHALCAGQ